MGNNDVPWEIPVHRSLVKPLYWMGVPRAVLILEILFGILCGVIFKTFLVPIMLVCIHFLFRYLGQRDSRFMDVFVRYLRHNRYYT